MLLTNGKVTVDLTNESHIDAFKSSGFTIVEEKPVKVAKTSTKSTKKETENNNN